MSDPATSERRGLQAVLAGGVLLTFAALFRWALPRATAFWMAMSGAVALWSAAAWLASQVLRQTLRKDGRSGAAWKTAGGLISAMALYAVFFVGRAVLPRILPAAEQDLAAIYGIRSGLPVWAVALLLAAVIGPGEELIWRAFLQDRLEAGAGRFRGGLAASLLYAVVHAGSGNPVLVTAALVCGLFWGALYARFHSFRLNAVSHAAWDLAVFVAFPF